VGDHRTELDALIERIRERAVDPDRRRDAQESAFFLGVTSMGAGQLVDAARSAFTDLGRLLVDPLDPPADLVARADQLAAQMQQPADQPLPAPACPHQLADAEAALGTRLPTLLHRLFLEVANGGFGPGYGLLGVDPAGWTDDRGQDLVALHASMRDHDGGDPSRWTWPASLLPIAHLGDAVYACIDTARPGSPVVEYDPSDLDWDDDGSPIDEGSAFVEVSPSLEAWLATWVDGPTWAEQQAAHEAELLANADEVVAEQMRRAWATLTPEQREEFGITDEMLESGRFPDL
jgi:hypothetical protein